MNDYDKLCELEIRNEILETLKAHSWFSTWGNKQGRLVVEKYGDEAVKKILSEPEIWEIGFKQEDSEKWCQFYEKLCTDELALKICSEHLYNIRYFSRAKNKDFVLEVMKNTHDLGCDFLGILSTEFKKNKDIVLAAVKKNGANYTFSSRAVAIREDIDIIKAAVASSPTVIEDIPSKFKLMKDVALIAVSQYGLALKDLHFFQDDRDVVMAAVKNHGEALGYVSNRLRHDREVSSEAIKSKSSAMAYVPEHFSSDLSFCLQALECRAGFAFLRHCDIELRCDKSFVQMAIEYYPANYAYASHSLKMDKDLYEPLIKVDGAEYFKLLPYELRNKPEIVNIAIEKAKQTYDTDFWGEKKDEKYQEVCGSVFQNAGTDVLKIIVEPNEIDRIFVETNQIDGCMKIQTNFSLERAYDGAGKHVFHVHTWKVTPGTKERQRLAIEKLNTYLLTQRLTSNLGSKDDQVQTPKPKRMKI